MYHYQSGIELLTALADLENDLKHNYENGNIGQKALANVGGLQADLFSSYMVLLGEDEKGPLIGRSVILRSIIENQGTILHLKDKPKRAEAYLAYVEKMQKQVKNHIEGKKISEEDLVWSKSTVKDRVKLIEDNAGRVYDTLSNFTHGNNILYFFNTKVLTDAYIKAIDSYFVGMFIGFMIELGIGLDMDDSKRKLVLDTINRVGKRKK